MLRQLRIPLLSWLTAAAITAAAGWLIVRFLPLYASIPLMILLVLAATFEGVFFAVGNGPHDSELSPLTRRLFWCLFFLSLGTPTVVAIGLFMRVG